MGFVRPFHCFDACQEPSYIRRYTEHEVHIQSYVALVLRNYLEQHDVGIVRIYGQDHCNSSRPLASFQMH